MANILEKTSSGFTRITLLLKQVRDEWAAKVGVLAALTTTSKSDIVSAINEVNAKTGNTSLINDGSTSTTTAWSSSKTNTEIANQIATVINGAGADDDTLAELASKVAALAQADTGLVSAAGAQAFDAAQKLQARTNIGAASAEDLGDVSSVDFVALINSTYAGA